MNMDTYCRRFLFSSDMNGDLAFTISDAWLVVKALILFPAAGVTSILHSNDHLAVFFEIDCQTGTGIGGALFSMLVWLVALAAISAAISARRIKE